VEEEEMYDPHSRRAGTARRNVRDARS